LKHADHEKILINQEEIGILGALFCYEINTNYFLLQLKAEPGNIPLIQWAPTVQATKSNYERVHKGKATPYLKFFSEKKAEDVIASEQGSKFLNKFNRNAVLKISQKNTPINELYKWISTEKLKEYLSKNYCVNTDLRSVIATSDWTLFTTIKKDIFLNGEKANKIRSAFNYSYQLIRPNVIVDALKLKSEYYTQSSNEWEIIPLKNLKQICIKDDGIYDNNQNRLVAYFDVVLPSREVEKWQQPLLCAKPTEKCALCFKIINEVAFFYLKIYPEIGYLDRVEYGPSLQTGSDINKINRKEYDLLIGKARLISSIYQTDEGGRFFQNKSKYEIVQMGSIDPNFFSDDIGFWLSAGELEKLCKQGGMVTNELRTCVSLLLSFA